MKRINIVLSSSLVNHIQTSDCAAYATALIVGARLAGNLMAYLMVLLQGQDSTFTDCPPELLKYFQPGTNSSGIIRRAFKICSGIEINLSPVPPNQIWLKAAWWPSGKRGKEPLCELQCAIEANGTISHSVLRSDQKD